MTCVEEEKKAAEEGQFAVVKTKKDSGICSSVREEASLG